MPTYLVDVVVTIEPLYISKSTVKSYVGEVVFSPWALINREPIGTLKAAPLYTFWVAKLKIFLTIANKSAEDTEVLALNLLRTPEIG